MKVKNIQAEKELCPEGTHNAICVSIVDMGTQTHPKWGDKRKISLTFEIQDEETSEGEPFYVYKRYTMSLAQRSTLAADLKTWKNIVVEKGEEFDLDELLGSGALVTVALAETDQGTYANIEAVSAPVKGTKMKKPVAALSSFYLDEDTAFDRAGYDDLSDWMKEKIAETPEYKNLTAKKVKEAPAKNGKQSKMDSQANPVLVKKGKR